MANSTSSNPSAPSAASNTLVNTGAFALSFAAWVMLGPSVRQISADVGISPANAALLKALPILVGSACRIPVGLLTDRLGARAMFAAVVLTSACGALAMSFADTLAALIAGGLVMGMAGTTFVVGVQSVSSWTEPGKQGAALGMFGAGNVGSALTTFGMPLLLASVGWRWSFRVYAAVLVCAAIGYSLRVRNKPRSGPAPTLANLLAPMRSLRALGFGLYYMATFGGFVAATLCLSDIYIDTYRLVPQTAGLLATTFTFSASLVRILGGRLADRFGGRTLLRVSLALISVAFTALAVLVPPLPLAVALVFVGGLAMGVGSAAVFKDIPKFFPKNVGAVGGIVGALGGIGGFVLPIAAAAVRVRVGSSLSALLPLGGLALLALAIDSISSRVDNAAVAAALGSLAPPARPSTRPAA